MAYIHTDRTPESVAIASGLVLSALMGTLVEKRILALDEVQTALTEANNALGPRSMTKVGSEVSSIIADFRSDLAQRRV
jgi:hypothetical protein